MNYNSMLLITVLIIPTIFNAYTMEKEDDGNGHNYEGNSCINTKITYGAIDTNAVRPALVVPITVPLVVAINNNGEDANADMLPAIEKKADNLERIKQQNQPKARHWIGNALLIATLVGLQVATYYTTYYSINAHNKASTAHFISQVCCPYFEHQTLCSNVTWDQSQCFEYPCTCAGIGK